MVSECIGFILTLIYVYYSGYIFKNDVAYQQMGYTSSISTSLLPSRLEKLYSNGATHKY